MGIIKAGADAGNSGLKLWVQDAQPVMIPTIYSLYTGYITQQMNIDEELTDIPKDELFDNIDVTINSKALKTNGERYLIGNKVLKDQIIPIELEENSDKAKDELPVILTLSGLAIEAIKRNYGKDKIDVTYDLSVSLPILTISPQIAKMNAERYMGTHEVIYHHPSKKDVKVNIKIDYCKCLPEGAAASWGVVYNEDGHVRVQKIELNDEVIKADFQDKTLLHFDIGAGTTEIVVTEGVKFNSQLSEGLNYGIKKTVSEIIAKWNASNPPRNNIDSHAEFNEVYFNSEDHRHQKLVSVSKIPFMQLSERLSKKIMNKIDSMKKDPYIFIYGGGASLLKEYIMDILMKKDSTYKITFLSEPIFVNAKGLLVYTCSPRFEQQKEKEIGVSNASEKK